MYPMDPDDCGDGSTEFDWGPGMFPPGIAKNQGQRYIQDDFGIHMKPPVLRTGNTIDDIHAKAVADRRTDPTDAESNRSFTTLGNPDRYGPQPPLVQADPEPDISHNPDRFGPRIPRLRREE